MAGHVTEVNFLVRYATALGVDPFPRLGPWKLGQHLGMMEASMMVMRSMEKGRKNETVQYGTARGVRSTLTAIWEASPASGRDIVLSSAIKKGRFIATFNPAKGRWFQYFNHGMMVRMGDEISQDRAFTAAIVRELLRMFEETWERDRWSMDLHEISTCMFLIVTCFGGVRGYEAMWTDLAALVYDILYCEMTMDYSAVAWPVVGIFKACGGVADCYMIPIAGETQSGVQIFTWTQRFVGILARQGRESGWAFAKPDGSRAVAPDYRECLFSKLEKIQQTTTLIDPDVDVWSAYGMQHSGRRFFTTECLNQGVSTHDIEVCSAVGQRTEPTESALHNAA